MTVTTRTVTDWAATPEWVADTQAKESALKKRQAMDLFLAGIERRGFQMARIAIGDPDEALDLVQDAMIRLVQNYSDKPEAEWQPLFFRILKNRIIDHHRRGNVRNRVVAWFKPKGDGDDVYDPVALAPGYVSDQPEHRLGNADAIEALELAMQTLPERQLQAFMLRTIEGMDVATTAEVMGCSEGSVKTHLSRALHKLRDLLEDYRPD